MHLVAEWSPRHRAQTCTKWHFSFLAPMLGVISIANRLAVGCPVVAFSRLNRLLLFIALILALAASPLAIALAIRLEGNIPVPRMRALVA